MENINNTSFNLGTTTQSSVTTSSSINSGTKFSTDLSSSTQSFNGNTSGMQTRSLDSQTTVESFDLGGFSDEPVMSATDENGSYFTKPSGGGTLRETAANIASDVMSAIARYRRMFYEHMMSAINSVAAVFSGNGNSATIDVESTPTPIATPSSVVTTPSPVPVPTPEPTSTPTATESYIPDILEVPETIILDEPEDVPVSTESIETEVSDVQVPVDGGFTGSIEGSTQLSPEYEIVKSFLDNDVGFLTGDEMLSIMGLSGDMSIEEAVDKLQEIYQSGRLTEMNSGDKNGLYNFYSSSEIQMVMMLIDDMYDGREASIRSTLALLSLAAAQGIKIKYSWNGGHETGSTTSLDAVCTGADCSGFCSWAIQQGDDASTFSTTNASNFTWKGTRIPVTDWAEAQPGDAIYSGSHVVYILENDPVNQVFVVAEEHDGDGGLVINRRSYNSLKKQGYGIVSLTEYYGD